MDTEKRRTKGEPAAGDAPGDQAMDAWVGLLRAHAALVDTLEHELQEAQGLPLTWYDVLVQLRAAGGQMRMQDLASAVLLSRSGVTRLVDRMETAGLVTRESCPSDRRGTFAAITPKGRDVFKRAHPVHLRGIERHFASVLTSAELQALAAIAAKVAPDRPTSCSGRPLDALASRR